MARRPRWRWTDDVLRQASLFDLFGHRTGLNGSDNRVHLAASPGHHRMLRQGYTFKPPDPAAGTLVLGEYHPPTDPLPAPTPRGPGRPEAEDFTACVKATTALVDELLAKKYPGQRRHDFVAVTIAMLWPGAWGPGGHVSDGNPWPRGRNARALEDLHDRIKDTFYRETKRRRRLALKPRRARIKPRSR